MGMERWEKKKKEAIGTHVYEMHKHKLVFIFWVSSVCTCAAAALRVRGCFVSSQMLNSGTSIISCNIFATLSLPLNYELYHAAAFLQKLT